MDFAPLKTFVENDAWDGKTQSVSFFEYNLHITHREVFENATCHIQFDTKIHSSSRVW